MVDAPTFDELIRRVRAGDQDQDEGRFVTARQGPSTKVAARVLLQKEVHRRLSPGERRLLKLRKQGHDWSAIATELGRGAKALRWRLSPALDRIDAQLRPEDAP